MKIKNILQFVLAAALFGSTFTSCKDMLTSDAKDVILPGEMYRNLDDANAAVRGVYGKMMDVATQYVVLNELRADLMDVTSNADLSLIQLAQHRDVNADNDWANPRAFFSLINTCNDVIFNFEQMYTDNKLSREQFYVRYSEVVSIRTWAYLQVSLHFADKEKGGVPYITKPLGDIESIGEAQLSKFPYLDLPTMIDSLCSTMESLPFKALISDDDLITTMDGYNTKTMYIDKEYLLGELNLWKGNYNRAAQYFKTIMERGQSGNDLYDLYKIPFDASATLDQGSARYNSGYVRYYENDINSAKNMWPLMFYETQTNNYYYEWLWVLYFDKLSEPNAFIDLFAKQGGSYLLKPSQLAMNNWKAQTQYNTFKGDFRGYFANYYGLPGSYDWEMGDPVIMKFIYNYSKYNPNYSELDKSGKWFLWRAASLHLHYAEAANRDGQHRVAYAIVNNGIAANYPGADTTAASNDYTLRNQTLLPFPYDFDARSTSISDVPPNLRRPWFRHKGIRSRVNLQSYTVESDSLITIENQILNESALELAFEGQRWGDLVRISLRRGDNSILANSVAEKLNRAGLDGEAVRTKLMDRSNWFLPLEW